MNIRAVREAFDELAQVVQGRVVGGIDYVFRRLVLGFDAGKAGSVCRCEVGGTSLVEQIAPFVLQGPKTGIILEDDAHCSGGAIGANDHVAVQRAFGELGARARQVDVRGFERSIIGGGFGESARHVFDQGHIKDSDH